MKFLIILIVLCLTSISAFCQTAGEALNDSIFLYSKPWINYSGKVDYKIGNDSISATFANGMLNGNYQSYYSNGKLKSKGEYKNNLRVGTWQLYSFDGKSFFKLSFSQSGHTFLKRLRNKGIGGVKWGRGKIHSYWKVPGEFYNDTLSSIIHFRKGLKQGKVQEYYQNGKLFAEYQYHKGLYNGKRILYYPNGNRMLEMQYNSGRPQGERLYFSSEGHLLDRRTFAENGSGSPLTYVDEFDIAQSFSISLMIDTTGFPKNYRIFPDSTPSLISVLNDAFYQSDISAYKNPSLGELVYSYHDSPFLFSRRDEKSNINNIRSALINANAIMIRQTNLMYIIPVSILPLMSLNKSNQDQFFATVWFYFPSIKPIMTSGIHNPSVINYPFLSKKTFINSDSNTPTHYYSLFNQLEMIEKEHDWWFLEYGIH